MNIFQNVKGANPRMNTFDLTHEKKLSFNMGELVPIYLQEILPKDKFKVQTELLLRVSPLIAPLMHWVNAYIHYFFVPNRLVMTTWEDFITGGIDGLQAPAFPKLQQLNGYKTYFYEGTLADYMGIPIMGTGTPSDTPYISALPFRAYQTIYNEYYRDQTLNPVIDYDKTSSVQTTDYAKLLTIRKRAWEKDYFTSCLPWTQRGGAVNVASTPTYKTQSDVVSAAAGALERDANGLLITPGPNSARIENIDSIATSVNNLRTAFKVQEWLERNARNGYRYIEQVLAHFGVVSSDARSQLPVYLGGGRTPITISEVLQTSKTDVSPQGNMAGHGIGVGQSNYFTKQFEEHGYVIGILSVIPRTAYQNGLNRVWQKFDKYDYFWPEFAELGEQAVLSKEIYQDYADSSANNNNVFGYQERYAEYKFNQSTVHGEFRSSLNHWHAGRIFSSRPSLNAAFVEADPTHRIFANTTTTVDKVYAQILNKVDALRPIPFNVTPINL